MVIQGFIAYCEDFILMEAFTILIANACDLNEECAADLMIV